MILQPFAKVIEKVIGSQRGVFNITFNVALVTKNGRHTGHDYILYIRAGTRFPEMYFTLDSGAVASSELTYGQIMGKICPFQNFPPPPELV